jgi:hypothetical protein
VFGGGSEDAQPWVVEHPGGGRVPAGRDIGARLLVQPPPGQAELGGHRQCFLVHDAMRLEQGIDVPRSPARIVGEGHRGAAEHVHVRDNASLGQPVAQMAESFFNTRAVE